MDILRGAALLGVLLVNLLIAMMSNTYDRVESQSKMIWSVQNVDLLEASYFMMRIRCDGGALTTAQLRTLGELSTEFARDTADLSDRENVQYHWIRVEDVPAIWERIEAVGLKTTEACGDCPRVVLGSPLAGDSVDEVLDPTPAIDEIVRRYIGDPKYSNLPRKFKTAISGLQDVAHEINDVAFIGVDSNKVTQCFWEMPRDRMAPHITTVHEHLDDGVDLDPAHVDLLDDEADEEEKA